MTNLKSQEIRGLTGLSNLGNTCFLNSCMQILSNINELNVILKSKSDIINSQKQNIDKKLIKEWIDLHSLMWSKNCIISPGRFVKTVQSVAKEKERDLFTGYAQNDLPEFLLFFMDSLHNSMKTTNVTMTIKGTAKNNTDILAKNCYAMMKEMYEKEYSPLYDLFYGISVTIINSSVKNETLSCKSEPYMTLDLAIPKKQQVTLEDCFDEYCKFELLEDENAWYNEKTKKKENVNKGIKFWNLPKILIITLKRFDDISRKKKNLVSINDMNNIDLSKYVVGYNKNLYKYELIGTCNHSGGQMGGHYTANFKKEDGKWYNYNDTNVDVIPERKAVTSEAYCLFLKKKHM